MAYRLVEESFEELISHRWSELSKRFGISAQDVQRAADEIAKLDPKPGLRYSAGGDNYIIPDLVVDKIGQAYHIFLNDGNLPRLKLSRAYQEIARDKKKFDTESKDFIASKLNSAHWMIQAIEQRRQTMLKVMHFIVDRQRDFFERGVQALRPLTSPRSVASPTRSSYKRRAACCRSSFSSRPGSPRAMVTTCPRAGSRTRSRSWCLGRTPRIRSPIKRSLRSCSRPVSRLRVVRSPSTGTNSACCLPVCESASDPRTRLNAISSLFE